MSANTIVDSTVWRSTRRILAMAAAAVVLMCGANSTVMAWQGLGNEQLASAMGRVDLVTAPAGAVELGEHSSASDAAQLTDAQRRDGLDPGQSAYFGYLLGLGAGGPAAAAVSILPVVDPDAVNLTYEVREVADAAQCRSGWRLGRELVAPREFTTSAVNAFLVGPDADLARPMQLCLRVTRSAAASTVRTAGVSWRFVGAPA